MSSGRRRPRHSGSTNDSAKSFSASRALPLRASAARRPCSRFSASVHSSSRRARRISSTDGGRFGAPFARRDAPPSSFLVRSLTVVERGGPIDSELAIKTPTRTSTRSKAVMWSRCDSVYFSYPRSTSPVRCRWVCDKANIHCCRYVIVLVARVVRPHRHSERITHHGSFSGGRRVGVGRR